MITESEIMRKRIESMIILIESDDYGPEDAHILYDNLLESFIKDFDSNLLPLMEKLISLEKRFWYV